METVGLDLDLLSEQNEESCSISHTLESLNDEDSSIRIPSNSTDNKQDTKKSDKPKQIGDSSGNSMPKKISPYVIQKIQNIGQYEIRSIAEVDEDHST